jgi:hypothetical protein
MLQPLQEEDFLQEMACQYESGRLLVKDLLARLGKSFVHNWHLDPVLPFFSFYSSRA